MTEKVLENTLGPLSHIMLAVACVAAVWLLLRDMGIGVSVSKAGFNASSTYGIGSNLALTAGSISEIGLAEPSQPELVLGVPALKGQLVAAYDRRDNFATGRPGRRAGLGGNEPPIYWSSTTDWNAVEASQQSGVAEEGQDMNMGGDASPADLPAVSGFRVGPPPGQFVPYVAQGAQGFQNPKVLANSLTSPY